MAVPGKFKTRFIVLRGRLRSTLGLQSEMIIGSGEGRGSNYQESTFGNTLADCEVVP